MKSFDKLNVLTVVTLLAWIISMGVISAILAYCVLTLESNAPVNMRAMYYASSPQIAHDGIHTKMLFDTEMYNTGGVDFDGYCFTPQEPGIYMVTLQYARMRRADGVYQFVDVGSAWMLIEDTEGNAWNLSTQRVFKEHDTYIHDFSLFGVRQVNAGVSVCVLAGQWGNPIMIIPEYAKFGIERIQ